MEENSIPWLQLLETVWRRRLLVLAIAAAGTLAAAVWIGLTPPQYRAHSTILLGAQRVSTPRTEAMADKAIDSEMALLASPVLVREVLADLGVVPAASPRSPSAASFDGKVRAFSKDVETNRVEDTNVVEVAYRGTDPRFAAAFVNKLLAKHVERIARLNSQPDERRFYQGQREVVYKRLETARDALSRFRERQGSDLAPGDDAELHKALAQLDTDRGTAESQLAEAQARAAYLHKEIGKYPAKIAAESDVRQSEPVRLLEQRLTQLEVQRSEAITKYTPTSTVVRDLDAQIAETRKLLSGREVAQTVGTKTAVNPTYQTVEIDLVQRQAEAVALAARVRALAAEQGKVRAQISRLANLAPELERLQNDDKSASDAYLDYMKKVEEARLTRALDQSGLVNISILEPAEVPGSPEPAKKPFKLLIGLVASLALAVAVALLRERLDPAVNSGGQAERMTGVPVIESIAG